MITRTLLPTDELLTDPEAHLIIRCSWCEKYYDKKTKEYKPRPEKDCGDGICPSCMKDVMEELDES